jgi:hypothetical protein
MQLQAGDRLPDETGEWEVVGRPYTTAGGKTAHVRVQRVGQPGVTQIRFWRCIPTAMWPMPDHEFSHVRSAHGARDEHAQGNSPRRFFRFSNLKQT